MVGVGVCVIAAAFSVLVFFAVPTMLVRRGRQEAHLHCCTPKIALSMCRNPNNPARRFSLDAACIQCRTEPLNMSFSNAHV